MAMEKKTATGRKNGIEIGTGTGTERGIGIGIKIARGVKKNPGTRKLTKSLKRDLMINPRHEVAVKKKQNPKIEFKIIHIIFYFFFF